LADFFHANKRHTHTHTNTQSHTHLHTHIKIHTNLFVDLQGNSDCFLGFWVSLRQM